MKMKGGMLMIWMQSLGVSLVIILIFTYGMYKTGIYEKNKYYD
jgi:hypothetical protein